MKIKHILIIVLIFTLETLYGSSLNKGEYKYYSFDKLANYRYTVKLDVTSGDCDLYGHHSGYPTKDNYHKKSANSSGKDESFTFDSTKNSKYYLSVYAYGNCSFNTPTFSKKINSEDVKITNVSPLTAVKGKVQNYTISGSNLPSSLVGNIEGTASYCSHVSGSGSKVILSCKADSVGKKRFYLKVKKGGTSIKGSENVYV